MRTLLVACWYCRASNVHQEKIVSLGYLSARVAHEIDNPINFVVSNVKPSKQELE